MTPSRRRITALTGALAALAPALALAQERAEARLSYEVEPDLACPEEPAFRDLVAARLGYDPFKPDAARVIETRIARQGMRLTGRVRVVDERGRAIGSRELRAAEGECDELASSIAIAVSILLDPFSAGGAPPPTPPPAPRAEPPAAPPPTPPPPCPEPEPRRDPARVWVGGELGASIGLTPGIAVGPGVAAGIAWSRLSLGIHGRADFTPLPAETDGGDAHVAIFGAGPRACARVELAIGCLGARAGILQGRGVDLAVERTDTGRFVAADVSAGIGIPAWSQTLVVVLADLQAPLSRTSLEIDGQTAWTAPPVAFGLRIGLHAFFAPSDDGSR